jgi:hypothetical protein
MKSQYFEDRHCDDGLKPYLTTTATGKRRNVFFEMISDDGALFLRLSAHSPAVWLHVRYCYTIIIEENGRKPEITPHPKLYEEKQFLQPGETMSIANGWNTELDLDQYGRQGANVGAFPIQIEIVRLETAVYSRLQLKENSKKPTLTSFTNTCSIPLHFR